MPATSAIRIPAVRTYLLGIPRPLLWGYVAVLLFMVGDGVESNYLAPFLNDRGLTVTTASAVISTYGIFVAIGSWFSGVLSNVYGPKRVMQLGAIIWVVFEVLFLAVAIPAEHTPLIFITYGLRGLAYPLFAYAFLLWIQLATKPERLGVASGWFWCVFTAGLPTLGSAIAAITIPLIGALGTLWISLGLVIAGGLIGSFTVRELHGVTPSLDRHSPEFSFGRELVRGIDIVVRQPRIAVAGVVRVINNAPYFGFFVFLPLVFERGIGWSTTEYLLLVTVMGLVGIAVDPFMGKLGDALGWRRTVGWVGCVGSAVMTLLLYWVPQAVPDQKWLAFVIAGAFGATLAGFIPLSAMMTNMVPARDKGNAMAVYSLAAGLCTFIGPFTYTLLGPTLGFGGVVAVYAALYLLGAVLTFVFLRTDADPADTRTRSAATSATEGETMPVR